MKSLESGCKHCAHTALEPPCQILVQNSKQEIIEKYFGPVCTAFRKTYSEKCPLICLMFKECHKRIENCFDLEVASAIKAMAEELILLGDENIPSNLEAIKLKAREAAQLLETHSSFNKKETKKNLGYGRHHKVTSLELYENFVKSPAAKRDFPRRWKKMLDEISDSLNTHFAREKFGSLKPSFKELFWTYLFGRAIECFGTHHPEEELSGLPSTPRI